MPADALPPLINGPILLTAFLGLAFLAFAAVALVIVVVTRKKPPQ